MSDTLTTTTADTPHPPAPLVIDKHRLRADEQEILNRIRRKHTDRHCDVYCLLIVQEWNGKRIAEAIGVSAMTISRIRADITTVVKDFYWENAERDRLREDPAQELDRSRENAALRRLTEISIEHLQEPAVDTTLLAVLHHVRPARNWQAWRKAQTVHNGVK